MDCGGALTGTGEVVRKEDIFTRLELVQDPINYQMRNIQFNDQVEHLETLSFDKLTMPPMLVSCNGKIKIYAINHQTHTFYGTLTFQFLKSSSFSKDVHLHVMVYI